MGTKQGKRIMGQFQRQTEVISGEFNSQGIPAHCGVRDDGDTSRGANDGEDEATGGCDIRGVQLAGGCEHDVVVYHDENKAGGVIDGEAGTVGRRDILTREFTLQNVVNTL
jgi:hypothetical protein